MKCHFNLKSFSIRSGLMLLMLTGALSMQSVHADNEIDRMNNHIKEYLKTATPENINLYDSLNTRLVVWLETFLNKTNTEPLQTHIDRGMELLKEYKQTIVDNPALAQVQQTTKKIHLGYTRLVEILRKYVGKKDAVFPLVTEIAPFKELVPEKVMRTYSATFIGCIRNRLKYS